MAIWPSDRNGQNASWTVLKIQRNGRVVNVFESQNVTTLRLHKTQVKEKYITIGSMIKIDMIKSLQATCSYFFFFIQD